MVFSRRFLRALFVSVASKKFTTSEHQVTAFVNCLQQSQVEKADFKKIFKYGAEYGFRFGSWGS